MDDRMHNIIVPTIVVNPNVTIHVFFLILKSTIAFIVVKSVINQPPNHHKCDKKNPKWVVYGIVLTKL